MGALADPVADGFDVRVVQLLRRRHLERWMRVGDRLQQQTLLGLTGDEDRSATSPFEEGLAGVDTELGELLGRTVTPRAAFEQDGADGGLEELRLLFER